MICVSIIEKKYEDIIGILIDTNLAEIRLDLVELSEKEIEKVFSQKNTPLIATCREGKYSDKERLCILKKAIIAGADYVDIEIESLEEYKRDLITHAVRNNCKVIISYHNYDTTPETEELIQLINDCYDQGADIIKIACFCNTISDAARMLSLYSVDIKDRSIVSIGMGEIGKITRVASVFLDSPFTYASTTKGKETASGQMEYETLKNVLNLILNKHGMKE